MRCEALITAVRRIATLIQKVLDARELGEDAMTVHDA